MLADRPQEQQEAGGQIYIADHRGVDFWFAMWRDHAANIIKKRLVPVEEVFDEDEEIVPPQSVIDLAAFAVDTYIEEHQRRLAIKRAASMEEQLELAQRADFPRMVVAAEVTRICDYIARYEDIEERRGSRPGLQLFADRTGISAREVTRILGDEERISVGAKIVDRICVEFDMLLDDFIVSALEWADKAGRWADRPGLPDAWPWGYATESVPEDEGII